MIEAILWFVLLLLLIPVLVVAGLVWTFCSFVFRTAALGIRLVMRPVFSLVFVLALAALLLVGSAAFLF